MLTRALAFADLYWGRRDIEAAWLLTDPLLRRCWGQAWLLPMRDKARSEGFDPDDVIEAFTADEPQHELWAHFVRAQSRVRPDEPRIDVRAWGVKVNPDPVGLDLELVRYLPTPASGVIQPEELYVAMPLLMRYTEGAGWRMLNFSGEVVPTPGWPPTMV